MKTLEDIKNTLSQHRKDISEEFRVKDMGVFGSFVRGEAKEDSDVDITVRGNRELEKVLGLIREAVRRLDRSGIRVARAILFGSFAQGRMREWSDIDVAMISRDYRPTDFKQRVRIGLICQDVDVRMETVVYRPEDFRKGEPLALEIKRTGIELRF